MIQSVTAQQTQPVGEEDEEKRAECRDIAGGEEEEEAESDGVWGERWRERSAAVRGVLPAARGSGGCYRRASSVPVAGVPALSGW